LAALLLLALLAACDNGGGAGDATPTPGAPTATSAPAPTDTPEIRIPDTPPAAEITVPDGFAAYELARDFYRATSIALAPNGDVYVSERHGNLFRMIDTNGDGVFEDRQTAASGFDELTGILFATDGTLYASSRSRVTTLRDSDGDGTFDQAADVISGLPVGRHQNDGLVFGPDGLLYVTLGSTCDDCVERNPLSGAILQANPDGSGLRVYASGLRNPYDIVFDSQGRLWATDNGSDTPCETIDELNLIVDGGDYGWPYAADGCDPLTDGIPPMASLGLHTASTGIDFYDGAHFPAAYGGNLFMTVWGSLVAVPQQYDRELLRGVITEGAAGPAVTIEHFASGFRHPIDVVVDRDGTLLVLDYGDESEGGGRLYRIVYTGA
jgi:glucose/arabinose dehydrogenase